MLYKQDWEETQRRFAAWLSGEELDRPLLQVTAPRRGAEVPSQWTGWNFVHDPAHPEQAIEQFEQHCQMTYFGGEAFPNLWINMGPGSLAAYLGCEPVVLPQTVWFREANLSWDEILQLRLDPRNEWWRRTQDFTRLACAHAAGKFFVGLTDLNAVLNVLAFLRGNERLLVDLIDSPEQVKQASHHILELWFACYDELLNITRRCTEGCSTWMGIWFPRRGSDVQCDFSAMISPAMFEEFAVPHLQEKCRRLNHSIYHWDGPGQIAHLDLLLDIPELDGIQWVPGAGNPTVGSPKWFDLYKKIQAKGKLLILQGMAKQDLQTILGELSCKGLLISTRCDNEQEARDLLRHAEKWARR